MKTNPSSLNWAGNWRNSPLLVMLALFSLTVPFSSTLVHASESQSIGTPSTLSTQELSHEIGSRLMRVPEFDFIRNEAERLGVKAYLFGGTAAGYAHYVKWDLLREKGDKRYQPNRFDYDYTNIYRSTQDLDIVIDGNAEQAQKLQKALQEKYPHLQGSKTAWEVRLLTQDMGDKQAILNNPDFLNQHTDSNSTGLIELTKPTHGDAVVRDARDWTSKEPYFLKDIHDGTLHYYFSPLHDTTRFAKEGRNPPILSAIRFLTKAFQYQLNIKPDDMARIQKIIHDFNPKVDAQNSYVANWIEKNGKKLIQNAVNIEYARNTLDQLGLRVKLSSIKSDPNQQGSLAWWLNKEPLRTQPIGQGQGKTAKELGIDIIAHETNTYLAYESITRAHTGDPNVLISRNGAVGEGAVYGNGFYTRVGREGARGTGLTIRFHLDPNAREGHDFTYEPGHNYVVIKNKAALTVIPESLNIGPVEYFKLLATGEAQFQKSDLGIIEKLRRRISTKGWALEENDLQEILKIVKNEIQSTEDLRGSAILTAWFKLPQASKYPELVDQILKKGTGNNFVLFSVLNQPYSKDHPEWIEYLLTHARSSTLQWLVKDIFPLPHWKDRINLIESVFDKNENQLNTSLAEEVGVHVFSKSDWLKREDLIARLISKKDPTINLAFDTHVFTQPQTIGYSKLLEQLIRNGTSRFPAGHIALAQPHWKDHPELMQLLIEKSDNLTYPVSALAKPHWQTHPELVISLIEKSESSPNPNFGATVIDNTLLSQPHWRDNPELLKLTGGLKPTYKRLKVGIERSKQGLKPVFSIRGCIYDMLNKRLSAE